jgi:hypothetical protein
VAAILDAQQPSLKRLRCFPSKLKGYGSKVGAQTTFLVPSPKTFEGIFLQMGGIMSSHLDSFAASGSSPTPDFEIENHQSIFLLRPLTPAAESWIEQFLPQDRMPFGSAVVVEHRYISEIVEGIRNDGLVVS